MNPFAYNSYRTLIRDHLKALPKEGRGEISKIATHLGVHQTLMSLILSGERELTLDQAFDLANYLHFTEEETEFLSLLVQFERAGNHKHKSFVKKKIEKMQSEANKIVNRFAHEKVLSDEQRSIFYSSWIYSAIRLFADTDPAGKSIEEICQRFQISRQKALELTQFLLSAGLLVLEKQRYKIGSQRTFLEQGSPHLLKHHSNWRIKGLQKSDHLTEQELMFTSPMSISKNDFARVREIIAQSLKEISEIIKDSPAEDVGCLSIDLFWVE